MVLADAVEHLFSTPWLQLLDVCGSCFPNRSVLQSRAVAPLLCGVCGAQVASERTVALSHPSRGLPKVAGGRVIQRLLCLSAE